MSKGRSAPSTHGVVPAEAGLQPLDNQVATACAGGPSLPVRNLSCAGPLRCRACSTSELVRTVETCKCRGAGALRSARTRESAMHGFRHQRGGDGG
eukprot:365067-Chlamydomonas_euryale.AAC.25